MIRHLPFLDHDRWYVINVDRSDGERPQWHSRLVSLHGPNSEASIEWSLLSMRYRFGLGFELGRNGSESDLGLNLYAGIVGSVYLRLRAPWTRWARIDKDTGRSDRYEPRHSGLRLFPYDGALFSWVLDMPEHSWSSGEPRWRRGSITTTTFMGRWDTDTVEAASGTTRIPLPEGNYPATWTEKVTTWRHVRPLGTWRDRILGVRRRRDFALSIEGGIPVEGKGENSWDCGMDGLFGCGGATLEDAIANAVGHVLRDRERYGGPHNLDRPMTVSEAGSR